MKKSLSFLILILLGSFNQVLVYAQHIQPVERTIGKLHISIDPRIELLYTIQLLSNYPFVNRDTPYSKEILSRFESFSSLEAVKLTDSLWEKHGFSHDAPFTFTLHLSKSSELEINIKFSDYLLKRSGEEDNLEQYRKSIKHFAEISKFEVFWNSKMSFYNQILDMTIANMNEVDLVKTLEEYYNETQDCYNIIILSSHGGGGYGPKITGVDGKDNIFALLSTTDIKDEIPYLSGSELTAYVLHEFGHSFVNPLTEKQADRVTSVDKLFEPIKEAMSKQAYGRWDFCLNEHIVRAIVIRLYELHIDPIRSKAILSYELSRRFIYIEPLLEKLKDFEKQRDEKNITFTDFYPELLNMLDSLQKIEYWKQVDMNFKGPIRGVATESKLAVIYPTNDLDTEALKKTQDYALLVFNTYAKSEESILLADTTALKTDLSEYGIISIGTIESNLFLKHYAHSFPFKVENKTIYADKEYTDKDIKLLTCVHNPHNPGKGMAIYTALSNSAIQDIDNIFYSGADYFLFLNLETIINSGFYNKNKKWTF